MCYAPATTVPRNTVGSPTYRRCPRHQERRVMLSATFRVLGASGYLKGEERIDRHSLARDCMVVLLEHPVEQADQAEIETKALIVAELRSKIFSDNGYGEDVEKDLDGLLTQIVAGDGAVQELLGDQAGDKYVLCSKRV